MSCGGCQRMRAHLPEMIRKRLEEVERRIDAARKPKSSVQIKYTTKPQTARTDPPQHLPENPPGGGSAGGGT